MSKATSRTPVTTSPTAPATSPPKSQDNRAATTQISSGPMTKTNTGRTSGTSPVVSTGESSGVKIPVSVLQGDLKNSARGRNKTNRKNPRAAHSTTIDQLRKAAAKRLSAT